MPTIYFAAAALGVLSATVVAAYLKTSKIRKQMRQQFNLQIKDAREEAQVRDHEPAAMASVG